LSYSGNLFENQGIILVKIPKLTAESDGSQLWDWMYFLSAKKREEFEMVAEKNEKVGQAFGRLEVLSKDERNYLLYEARERERVDNLMRERSAREEGRESILTELVKKKLARGESVAKISEALEEDVIKIEEIIRSLSEESVWPELDS
jgi:predicted transcriptional regulator